MIVKPLTSAPTISVSQPQGGMTEPPEPKKVQAEVLPEKKQEELPREELDAVVEKMNETVQIYNYNLKFEVVNKNRVVISVINSDTGEILKQIPPEDLISAFKRMDECLGVLVDRKV